MTARQGSQSPHGSHEPKGPLIGAHATVAGGLAAVRRRAQQAVAAALPQRPGLGEASRP